MKTTQSINVELDDTDVRDILVKYLQTQYPQEGEWVLNISSTRGRGLDDQDYLTVRASKTTE